MIINSLGLIMTCTPLILLLIILKKQALFNESSSKSLMQQKLIQMDLIKELFCNPPYGDRLGETKQLEELYYQYGENLKSNFKGFNAFIFTGNQDLRKKSLSEHQRELSYITVQLNVDY